MTKTCVMCENDTTETMTARVGDRSGPVCADCQYWCDGNITES